MTEAQPSLFSLEDSRFDQWKQFHGKNLSVWRLFRSFALEAHRAGRTQLSARLIGERIRWFCTIETTDQEFKVNDHHWPYYARLLAGTEQRFQGFFTFKDAKFDATTEDIVAAHREATAKAYEDGSSD